MTHNSPLQHSFAGKELQIGGHPITFDVPVVQTLCVDDLIIVLLGSGGSAPNATRNVLAYHERGTLCWRIQPSPYGGVPDPFVGMRLEDNSLVVGASTGLQYKVNLANGFLDSIVRFTK
jgi:hypothetical protein